VRTVLVSKRVGNVQNHLQWFTLLDQLWAKEAENTLLARNTQ
jgi:hypothetical protein